MNLRLRFFIQWSQASDPQCWMCEECGGKARGVEYFVVNAKGKRERKLRQDHDSIIHTDVEGDGNRMVHQYNCKFLLGYLAQIPVATELVA
jgi:hypothetical protein